MTDFSKFGITIPTILLPISDIELKKWSVIACDQFTSEPEYWNQLGEFIGDSPSTLHMILPEVYLGKSDQELRIQKTKEMMTKYLKNEYFVEYNGFVLVERTIVDKNDPQKRITRNGLVLALDLEQYDFNRGSQSLIRATEGTIIDRLPPRIKIRKGASIELPHILVLIDDPENSVIEPLVRKKKEFEQLYNFDLYADSGHINGYLIDHENDLTEIYNAFQHLMSPEIFSSKYNVSTEDKGLLLFAMGDGNHSLATAKAIWEDIKSEVGMNHPARYALVEIENVHDDGLMFEPIHRILTGVIGNLETDLKAYYPDHVEFSLCPSRNEMIRKVDQQPNNDCHLIGWIHDGQYHIIQVNQPQSNLPVGTLQNFLDEWGKNGQYEEIDYVHGTDVIMANANQPGFMGFYLPVMQKSDLFKTVILDGSLPRKTFSLGEARAKRFYLECRKIIK